MSGTSIDAQKRYAAGTKAILESYFSGKHDYKPEDLIVTGGDYATSSYPTFLYKDFANATQRHTASAATSPARRRRTTARSREGEAGEQSEEAMSCII